MKTFNQFLKESGKTWSEADFQHIIASSRELEPFDQKAGEHLRTKYLPALITFLNQYATGDVPNPVFINIKDTANRFVDLATKFPARIYAIVRGNTAIDTYDYSVSSTHVVPGKLKKVQSALAKGPSAATEFYKWLEPILVELAPVAAAVENMKGRIVKRQPKAAEDMHAKYVAPLASRESGKLVVDALTKMSQAIYDDFATAVFDFYVREAESLNGMTYDEQHKSKNDVLQLHAIWNAGDFYTTPRKPKTLMKNFKDTLRKEAKKAADEMQQTFVYKNAKKLASIMDAKKAGLETRPTILKAQAGAHGTFEGDMRINFADGSSFEVRNQVVFKRSQYGKWFTQYPTTFHNVTLPNGSKMGQPSEERMNEIFAKA
jgi:hypothetical protein